MGSADCCQDGWSIFTGKLVTFLSKFYEHTNFSSPREQVHTFWYRKTFYHGCSKNPINLKKKSMKDRQSGNKHMPHTHPQIYFDKSLIKGLQPRLPLTLSTTQCKQCVRRFCTFFIKWSFFSFSCCSVKRIDTLYVNSTSLRPLIFRKSWTLRNTFELLKLILIVVQKNV